MRTVGLTGGIASGKSAVSRLLAEKGFSVIDADQVARDIVRPGSNCYRAIIERFGTDILEKNESINRKKLGSIVFADTRARKDLEAITHPVIRTRIWKLIHDLETAGVEMVFVEAALLVETGMYKDYDVLVVVGAAPEVQIQRIMRRDGLSPEEAQRRIASQLSVEKKCELADYVIANDGSLDELEAHVMALIHYLQG